MKAFNIRSNLPKDEMICNIRMNSNMEAASREWRLATEQNGSAKKSFRLIEFIGKSV